jgi:hypothetical protein
VQDAIAPPLAAWQSFYVIVGSSGAALTGLQFVVIVLLADSRRRRTIFEVDAFGREIDAFGTPTIVHFCVALLMGAVLSAPWQTLSSVAFVLGACGAAGMSYIGVVAKRARRQTGYQPVLKDWVWHTVFPFIAYATLLAAAAVLVRHNSAALFAIAATALLLLFVGIHNAWDTVTFIAVERAGEQQQEDEHGGGD